MLSRGRRERCLRDSDQPQELADETEDDALKPLQSQQFRDLPTISFFFPHARRTHSSKQSPLDFQ